MTWLEYFALPAMNWTRLQRLDDSPKHFRHAIQNERADTDTLAIGRYVHTATMEPERIEEDFAIWDGARRSGADWKAFAAANVDKTILRAADLAEADAMAAEVRAHPYVAELLADPETVVEDTIRWLDVESATPCKGRPDIRNKRRRIVADLKTSKSTDLRRFANDVVRYKYPGQLAFYGEGIAQAEGWAPAEHVLIVVEKAAPYDVAIFPMDADTIQIGREQFRGLLTKFCECTESGRWPGRHPDPVELNASNIPPWFYGGGIPEFAFESEM